jgi:peroxiredoxin
MRWSALLFLVIALPAWSDEAFTFVDRRGQPVVVLPEAKESGQALLLHFWATWCPECSDDLAHLEDAISGCDHVRVLAINAGDGEAEVEAFVAQHALGLAVLRDPKGESWRRLEGGGLPMNAYWSAAGRKTDLGPKTREQWETVLASLGCPR